MNKEEIIAKIENALFPSKEEEDTIEHVDMGYKEFMSLIRKLAE